MTRLGVPTLEDWELVRQWRNECLESLRTPFPLTYEQQQEHYRNVVCNREARARWWTVLDEFPEVGNAMVGAVGLENIEWENGRAEISLIVDPHLKRKGFGREAVKLVLEQAFNHLRLYSVYGECYDCSPAREFWQKIVESYSPHWDRTRPSVKYRNGEYHGSYLFTFFTPPIWLGISPWNEKPGVVNDVAPGGG